ncbi:MAG TPA: TetR/AcrR family transcriptional regulator [Acidimicrobiales bacterium]
MADPSENLSRASYFAAAMDVLAEEGASGVTIAALCARLQVTKGSFYYHFRGRSDFVAALLDYWATEHASRLIRISESVEDPIKRISVLKNIAVGLPHGAEAAIRAWSSQDPDVAAVQARVDQSRERHLHDSCLAAGVPDPRAATLATMSLSLLIGIQQLRRPAAPELVAAVFGELEQLVLGAVLR